MPVSYGSPSAFRQALETRLRNLSQNTGVDVEWLRRQVAFERFLARIFRQSDAGWLLKGGYAMELRLQRPGRTTLDIDLMATSIEELAIAADHRKGREAITAYERLQELAETDLGDFFRYFLARPKPITTAPGGGLRCSVDCRVGPRPFTGFHLDVSLGDVVLGEPEWVGTRGLLDFAGIPTCSVPLMSAAQQIAEKLHAYTYPWEGRQNTRVKDLVDLVLLLEAQPPDDEDIRAAIEATFGHRGTHLVPQRLPRPPESWLEPFKALAGELSLPVQTLPEAFRHVDEKWSKWLGG